MNRQRRQTRETARLAAALTLPFCVSDITINTLERLYPERRFAPGQSAAPAHPVMTSHLHIATQRLHHVASEFPGHLIEIGPNMRAFGELRQRKLGMAHACTKTSPRDIVRHTKALSYPGVRCNLDVYRATAALAAGQPHHPIACVGGFDACVYQAETAVAIHSLYDITPSELLIGMEMHGTKIIFAAMHFPTPLLQCSEFHDPDEGYYARLDRSGPPGFLRAEFGFLGDASFPYSHNWDTWSSYFTKSGFTDGYRSVSIEKTERHGVQFFLTITSVPTVIDCPFLLPTTAPSHVLVPDLVHAASYAFFPDYRPIANITPANAPPKMQWIAADKRKVSDLMDHLLTRLDKSFDLPAAWAYARTQRRSLYLDHELLEEAWDADCSELGRIVVSVFLLAMVERQRGHAACSVARTDVAGGAPGTLLSRLGAGARSILDLAVHNLIPLFRSKNEAARDRFLNLLTDRRHAGDTNLPDLLTANASFLAYCSLIPFSACSCGGALRITDAPPPEPIDVEALVVPAPTHHPPEVRVVEVADLAEAYEVVEELPEPLTLYERLTPVTVQNAVLSCARRVIPTIMVAAAQTAVALTAPNFNVDTLTVDIEVLTHPCGPVMMANQDDLTQLRAAFHMAGAGILESFSDAIDNMFRDHPELNVHRTTDHLWFKFAPSSYAGHAFYRSGGLLQHVAPNWSPATGNLDPFMPRINPFQRDFFTFFTEWTASNAPASLAVTGLDDFAVIDCHHTLNRAPFAFAQNLWDIATTVSRNMSPYTRITHATQVARLTEWSDAEPCILPGFGAAIPCSVPEPMSEFGTFIHDRPPLGDVVACAFGRVVDRIRPHMPLAYPYFPPIMPDDSTVISPPTTFLQNLNRLARGLPWQYAEPDRPYSLQIPWASTFTQHEELELAASTATAPMRAGISTVRIPLYFTTLRFNPTSLVIGGALFVFRTATLFTVCYVAIRAASAVRRRLLWLAPRRPPKRGGVITRYVPLQPEGDDASHFEDALDDLGEAAAPPPRFPVLPPSFPEPDVRELERFIASTLASVGAADPVEIAELKRKCADVVSRVGPDIPLSLGRYRLLTGPPGSGKSKTVAETLPKNTVVVCPTRDLAREWDQRGHRGITTHLAIIQSENFPDHIVIDECFAFPAGYIFFISRKCSKVTLLGDPHQITFIDFEQTFPGALLIDSYPILTYRLNTTHRCPKDITDSPLFQSLYPGCVSHSRVDTSITSDDTDVPAGAHIITLSQESKAAMKLAYPLHHVNTAHEVQGRTFDEVLFAVRNNDSDRRLLLSNKHVFVAFTRHTSKLILSGDDLAQALGRAAEPGATALNFVDDIAIVLEHAGCGQPQQMLELNRPFTFEASLPKTIPPDGASDAETAISAMNRMFPSLRRNFDVDLLSTNHLPSTGDVKVRLRPNLLQSAMAQHDRTRDTFRHLPTAPMGRHSHNTLASAELAGAIHRLCKGVKNLGDEAAYRLASNLYEHLNRYVDFKPISSVDGALDTACVEMIRKIHERRQTGDHFAQVAHDITVRAKLHAKAQFKADLTPLAEIKNKAAQGITAWSKQNNITVAAWARALELQFLAYARPNFIFSSRLTDLETLSLLDLHRDPELRHLSNDFTEFDSAQNNVEKHLIRIILTEIGCPAHVINHYENLRSRRLVYGSAARFVLHDKRDSGEPFTLIGNTAFNAAVVLRLVLGDVRFAIFKGDDSYVNGYDVRWDEATISSFKQNCNWHLKPDIGASAEFTTFIIGPDGSAINIPRVMARLSGKLLYDEEAWVEYCQSLHDRLRPALNSVAVAERWCAVNAHHFDKPPNTMRAVLDFLLLCARGAIPYSHLITSRRATHLASADTPQAR